MWNISGSRSHIRLSSEQLSSQTPPHHPQRIRCRPRRPELQSHRARVPLPLQPRQFLLQRQATAARFVPPGVVGDVDVEYTVKVSSDDVFGVFAHHHGMVHAIGDDDFGAVDRVADVEAFGRAGQIIAGVIDAIVERLLA